ncbi:uncharacterized protein LOC5513199 [Nematostella vectensis]|uniref:uncharacterized protein LOC5513199 n=1 Tax=Nematostella vectensis TaxID=45351 RepID=UPI0013904641|nr:uncharacterized protein LOC5513199 [Nematostella vectensis]
MAGEIIAGYEEMFAKRYTSEDPDYMKAVNSKTIASPPCIENWLTAGYRRDDRRDHGGRYGERYHPYQRDDRGYQGDRYGNDRYGNRPQDRRDDRRRDNYSRRKPTDYGSEGYYQFYY